jgi:hypothetical protein
MPVGQAPLPLEKPMANVPPNALEIACTDGTLNEPQLRAFRALCHRYPDTDFVAHGFPADQRSFPVLVKRGLFEWRDMPVDKGYFFTEKGRELRYYVLQE